MLTGVCVSDGKRKRKTKKPTEIDGRRERGRQKEMGEERELGK